MHMNRFFDRLIEDMIAFEDVNPNRVFVMGYGSGGDGVYQIAPRMADHWAAAAMMTGHPNTVSPLSLRNVPFTLHVGERDAAFDRNKLAREFGQSLDALRANDAKGYEHFVQLHPGMDRSHPADAVAIPWMSKYSRDPVPDRVVWKQVGVFLDRILFPSRHSDRLYWLAVPPGEVNLDSLVIASRAGQTIEINTVDGVKRLLVRLDDRMADLDKPVLVKHAGAVLASSIVPRTMEVMIRTLIGRGDPDLMFSAEVEVDLPSAPEQNWDPDAIRPVNEAEIKRVSALPAARQIEEVREQLKRRNPGFNGELATKTDGGAVTALSFSTDQVADIAPVRLLTQLKALTISGSNALKGKVVDLSPLKGLKLSDLDVGQNPIHDISPLEGMPLTRLHLWQWTGTDLRPLKGMPLQSLNVGGGTQKIDLAPIADLPLDFLCINHTLITDLAPIKKMPLTALLCANTPVADLSPLRGMKIRRLEMYKTMVYDLSPLKGLPLELLHCEDSKVLDLSPVKDLPLKEIRCNFNPKRDSELFRGIKTLETINEKPAAEFWKALDK
jgi:hypothetical protein